MAKKRKGKSSIETDSTLSLKERLAEKRKAIQARKAAVSFISMATMTSIVVGMALFAIGGIKGGGGGFVGVLTLMLSFKFPWYALHAFLIYMPFGGTITYATVGNNPLMQLAKDGMYIPALVAIYQYCKQHKFSMMIPKSMKTPLLLLLVYCVLVLLFVNGAQQFTGRPSEKPFFMGILGLKVLLGYAPLIPCAYYLMKRKQDVYNLMRITVVVVIICCGLAFVQYMMLKTGRCKGTVGEGAELFKASLDARCFVGGALLYTPEQGVIRLPGTFVAPWQWGWYLITSAFTTFAVTFFDRNLIWKIIGGIGMVMTIIMAVICGQRIALMLVPTVIVIQLFTTGQIANLKRFIPIGVGLAGAIVVAMASNPAVVQERIDSAVGRWNASPPDAFIQEQFEMVVSGASLLGKGLGRATNSARALGDTRLIETYYPKVMYEIGPIGTILFLVLVTTLTIACFRAFRGIKDKNIRGYGAVFWTFVLCISYNTYYYPLDVDPVAVYYWFFAGVALKLPELDRLEPLPIEDPKKKKKKRK
ncbi:hormogonium polysaccharide biosynthesis protein HpsL [Leptolyngbya sp. AN03gr2]|uniref:hormogonium polysaccharide biosynthesis protein HpsL n=1 Tax=unclassified Leptolyngbya TaxID=2650499 RepID=UPI003D32084E